MMFLGAEERRGFAEEKCGSSGIKAALQILLLTNKILKESLVLCKQPFTKTPKCR